VIRNLTMSFKPVWLMGVGTLAGLLFLLLFACLLMLVHRRSAEVFWDVLRQRVVWPVLLLAAILGGFSLTMVVIDATGGRFYDQKADAITSLLRLPFVGTKTWEIQVPSGTSDLAVAMDIPAGELKSLKIESKQPLTIGLNVPPETAIRGDQTLELLAAESFEWTRGRNPSGPLTETLDSLFVVNDSGSTATLTLNRTTQPEVPEARIIVFSAVGLVLFVLAYWVVGLLFPKIAAVALATG